jgi:hypothetical protein
VRVVELVGLNFKSKWAGVDQVPVDAREGETGSCKLRGQWRAGMITRLMLTGQVPERNAGGIISHCRMIHTKAGASNTLVWLWLFPIYLNNYWLYLHKVPKNYLDR